MDGVGNMHSYSFTPEDMFWGQLAGCLEAIDAGTTYVLDHSHGNYTPEHGMLLFPCLFLAPASLLLRLALPCRSCLLIRARLLLAHSSAYALAYWPCSSLLPSRPISLVLTSSSSLLPSHSCPVALTHYHPPNKY